MVVAVVAAFASVSCGAAAEKASEKATEKMIESQTGGDVDAKLSYGELEIELLDAVPPARDLARGEPVAIRARHQPDRPSPHPLGHPQAATLRQWGSGGGGRAGARRLGLGLFNHPRAEVDPGHVQALCVKHLAHRPRSTGDVEDPARLGANSAEQE